MDPITLAHPFKKPRGGDTVSELTLRRLKMGDVEAMTAAEEKQGALFGSMVLVARLSGLTVDDIREMDPGDFAAAAKVSTGFLEASEKQMSGDGS